ncbi:MAG: HAMP domain-containing sensor histidine kinase [Marmoricola sp.]
MTLAPSSLRNRLVLGAVAVGLVFAVLFGIAATWRVHHVEDQALRAALLSRVELARDEVAGDGSLTRDAGSPKTDLVQVVGPDGKSRSSSPALAGVPPLVDVADATRSRQGVRTRITLRQPDIDLAVLGVPIQLARSGTSPAGTGVLVVAVDAEGFNAVTSDLLALLVGLVAVVLAMAALSWILTGRALDSVTRLTESAELIGPRELASGLPVPRRDAELARLVGALNRMLVRLHASHSTELAFAADAGHRLRTPVATLRAEAELALRENDPAVLTKALERIVGDADQLTSIVDRMLARSRSRGNVSEPVVASLETAVVRWRRQAELSGIELSIRMDARVTPELRCAELVEIIEPIFDNATRHADVGGTVDIHARIAPAPATALVIDISNTGPDVPTDLAPHVFDAWVSSRDASVAGGLGLWLARETAREAGGDVTLPDGDGPTTFRVVLPLQATS